MRPLTATLLVVVAVALFAGWFFATHERVERERFVGFSGEAYRNPFFAAELFTKELGFDAASRAALEPANWLPSNDDTIVAEASLDLLTGGEFQLLWHWVSEGGHLVLIGPEGRAPDDGLEIEIAGVRIEHSVHYEDWLTDARESGQSDPDPQLFHQNQLIIVDNDRDYDVLTAYDEIIAARSEWGNGFVTVVESTDLFSNNGLASPYRAGLFANLVTGFIEPGKVWFVFDTSFTPLWKLVWTAAPWLVIGLVLVALAWLWRALSVFGPRIVAEREERRSIIEHLHASGLFVWRQAGSASLADSSVRALVREAGTAHPRLSGQSAQQQANAIARITGLTPAAVLEVIAGHPESRHREFTRYIQKLQSIRKEL